MTSTQHRGLLLLATVLTGLLLSHHLVAAHNTGPTHEIKQRQLIDTSPSPSMTPSMTPNATVAATPIGIVLLASAESFAILSKTGISTTGSTAIVGDIGVSPIAASAITGFALTADPSNQFATSALVTGQVFASDYAPPTPTKMTTTIGDMEAAYTDAASRSGPDSLNFMDGILNGQTLAPGLYKWGSAVSITNGITFHGDASAVWILQVDNRLTLAGGANIVLSGGAQAKNIFWQTAEGATLGITSHFEGILLTASDVAVQTGASVNGNLYAQKAVTIDAGIITGKLAPAPSASPSASASATPLASGASPSGTALVTPRPTTSPASNGGSTASSSLNVGLIAGTLVASLLASTSAIAHAQ